MVFVLPQNQVPMSSRCLGLTRNLRRCRSRGSWKLRLCHHHRYQPLVLASIILSLLAGFASIHSAWLSDSHQGQETAQIDELRIALQESLVVSLEIIIAVGSEAALAETIHQPNSSINALVTRLEGLLAKFLTRLDEDELDSHTALMLKLARGTIANAKGNYQATLDLVTPDVIAGHERGLLDALVVRGNALFGENRWEEALACFVQLEKQPLLESNEYHMINVSVKTRIATILVNLHRYDDALDILATAAGLEPRSPEVSYLAGVAHIKSEHYLQALASFRLALSYNPSHARSHHGIAISQWKRGLYQSALESCGAALQNSEESTFYNTKGVVLIMLDKPSEALPALLRGIQLDPSVANFYYNLGCAYAETDDPQSARKAYEACIARNPGDGPATYNLAGALWDLGLQEQAVRGLFSLVHTSPDPLQRLHFFLTELSDKEAAIQLAQELCGLMPNSILAQITLATVLSDAGQSRAALKLATELVEEAPSNVRIWHVMGIALLRLGQAKDAVQAFTESISLDDEFAHGHDGMASSLGLSGDLEGAVKHSRRAVELAPQSALFQYNLAHSLRNLGDPEEALAAIDCSIDLDQGNPIAHNERGLVLANLQRYEEESRSYEEALRLDPGNCMYRGNLSASLNSRGMHAEALEVLKDGLIVDPDNTELLEKKGTALMALNRHREALVIFLKMSKLDPTDWQSLYNASCICSLGGEGDRSLVLLERSGALNKRALELAKEDPDFDFIRSHDSLGERFNDLISSR